MTRCPSRAGAFFSSVLLLGGCAGLFAGLSARGIVGGQTIETRVDSEAARYYLSSYLAGKRNDAALDERIDRVYRKANGSLPDRAELKRLSEEFSLDFAALYLADWIDRMPVNRRFRAAFNQAYRDTRNGFKTSPGALAGATAGYEVVFVPGYLYKRAPITGADFAAPRSAIRAMGFSHYFVETDEDGAIETNAALVAAAIRARARSGRRLIVMTASKSGPELALALTKLGPAETRHVAAWINAVGALQGTPLADERLLPEVEDLVGKVDTAGVESLTTERSRRRFDGFRISEHVLVVNYIAIPLTGSISRLARMGFLPLRKHGPNDGMTLLSDSIFPGGVTLPEVGRDHFLLGVEVEATAVALTMTVIRWLEDDSLKPSEAPTR